MQGYDKGKIIVDVKNINEFNRVDPMHYVKVMLFIRYHEVCGSFSSRYRCGHGQIPFVETLALFTYPL
jgi:hypothetical protein